MHEHLNKPDLMAFEDSHEARPSSNGVGFEVIQAELDEIDEVWKQDRFDSLPHVVEILTSQVPEDAIQSLREQRDAIEDIVDDVVRGYHNGFNKAFHNYSQILKVFGDSTTTVSALKTDLDKAKELLGSRNKQLQQLWYRSVTLRHIMSLLDQIENVSQVPSRIEKFIAEKQYYAAVQLYLQSTSLLDREGTNGVGALQDVRSDLSKLRGTLFFKVVDDLHLHLYNKGDYSVKPILDCDADNDITTIPVVNVLTPNGTHTGSRRTRSTRKTETDSDGRFGSERLRSSRAGVGSFSVDGKEDEGSQTGDDIDGSMSDGIIVNGIGEGNVTKDMRLSRSGLPSWLTESTPNEFIDMITKSESSTHVKYLQTMVECLASLGKIAAAGAMLSQKLRPTIHDLITAEIKARAAAIDASRPRLDQVLRTVVNGVKHPSSFKRPLSSNEMAFKGSLETRPFTGSVNPSVGPMGVGQVAAQDLLESILEHVSQVLENHVVVGETMEAKSIAYSDANSPRRANGDLSWLADPDIARATGGYSLSFALTVIQSECQQLICDILRATPDAATADAAVQTARLASKLPAKDSSNGASDEGLSFAFRFTDTVFSTSGLDGSRQIASRRNPGGAQEGYGTGAVLPERGIYLIAAVYRPILQFTDKVLQLLPPKYSQLGNDGLQSFVENFVKDQFLPPVRVDYRNRVQDALASPAAFRPKSRAGGLYELSTGKGRPVLQGPLAATQLANEVVSWAHPMPKYAGDFVEVAQALLERTLERCRASYTEAVLGSLSSSIVGRPDFENLMRQEPDSILLDALHAGEVGKLLEEDNLDSEGLEVELEINNLLMSYRPVKQEQLIVDCNKLVLLAALSDSLDYVAEAIEKLGQNTVASYPGRKDSQHLYHHRRTSSALTTSLNVLADKYQALSAECLRTLRVEMQLTALYHTQCMTERNYAIDQDAEEPEDFVLSLTMQITRLDEEVMPYVPAHKRKYIFGGICGVLSTYFIKVLNDLGMINVFGIRQVCQNCIGIEQALSALSSSDGNAVRQRLERVRTYYELLNLPFEALSAYVSENPAQYSFSESTTL
ncbi:hypothetical protein GOP47_0012382 [Adiantum capillus-veneris]|uniref:Exocyst complex component Sec8 n=1 Tax=Adiantum capillus-veneris TaxID=13818 RepID=A0A9D4UQT7_ADICA|nr:hypothetical protein GOP47_0012382 [Adiantum capillus-veneris]